MIRSQLNSYSGADPIWGFVALIGTERYTGEAAVGIDPRVRLFAVEGRVYFAEREGDAPIGTRLVSCGAVSTTQLEAGAVQIGETTSLARLFQRQPSIDRDAVELTIELATESLLESVANKAVGMPEVFPLRHHSSGVHHWLRTGTAPAPLPVADTPAVVPVEETVAAVVEETLRAVTPADDLRFLIEVETAEEVLIAEEPAVEVPAVEEAIIEETVVEEEAVVVEEEAVVVEEEAVVVEEEAVVVEQEAVVEEAFVEDSVSEEAIVEEDVAEELVAPAATFTLPTPSWFAAAAAEEPTLEDAPVTELCVEEIGEIQGSEGTQSADDEIVEDFVAEAAPVGEPVPSSMPMPTPTLASLTLPTLHSTPAQLPVLEPDYLVAPVPAAANPQDFFASPPEQSTIASAPHYAPVEPLAELPKLASAPTSIRDLPAANPSPTTAFGEPTHGLAAVDIWEMVDVLTDDGHHNDQDLVGSGASDKRGRSWLRGKKG